MQQIIFLAPPPGGLGRGQKVKYHLVSITKSISKIVIPNFVCVLTNKKNMNHIEQGFHSVALVIPQGWGYGVHGDQTFNFSKHGHVHIKLKWMVIRTGKIFTLWSEW